VELVAVSVAVASVSSAARPVEVEDVEDVEVSPELEEEPMSPELLAAVLLSVGSMTYGVSMLQAPSSRVDVSAE
jgi:hypothetical protein